MHYANLISHAVFPELTVGIVEAAEQANYELAACRQGTLSDFFQVAMKGYGIVPACGAILNARGIGGNIVPAPLRLLSSEQQERLLQEPVVKRILQTETDLAT